MMGKPKHFYSEAWKMNYWYCLGWSEKRFKKLVLKEFDYVIEGLENSNGRCLYCEKDNFVIMVIWTRHKSCPSILVHECAHAANFTMQKAGWVMDYDNSEPYTYLIEAIFREAIKK